MPPSIRSPGATPGDDLSTSAAPTVLQVVPRLIAGGAERSAVDVAVALTEAGGRALVASAGGPMVHELTRAGIGHITLPLQAKGPLAIRRNARRLAELIAAERIDLVHARSRGPGWSAWLACRRAGVPLVTTVHAAYGAQNRVKRLYNSVMVRGRRVIAISDFIHRYIVETYGVEPERLRTVPRGIDLGRFAPDRVSPERVIALARKWRLPDDAPIILMPARVSRRKGHMVLLDALTAIADRPFHCLLVGPEERSSFAREVEARVRTLGLGGRVQMTGPCDDMPAAYMLADVVVHATVDSEGFGRTVVEAQAMGRPIVATRTGGPPETVIEEETGLLVPPADPGALAIALDRALDLTPEQRDWLSTRAVAHVAAHFDKHKMTAATLAIYEEVLAEVAS